MISTNISLHLIYRFRSPFPKIIWLAGERVPKASAGSWFPELYGPTYKGIFFDVCPLLSAPNFPIIIDSTTTTATTITTTTSSTATTTTTSNSSSNSGGCSSSGIIIVIIIIIISSSSSNSCGGDYG
jgi:hypothetical protein